MSGVDVEAIAQELLKKQDPLTREEILQLAFNLPDQGQRKAANERGSAFFAGAYRHGGITRLRSSCHSWPWSIQAIARYIQQKVPENVFTSFAVLCDQEAEPHRDSGNEPVPNVVIKLSDFRGGGLWIEDPLGLDRREIDGRAIQGTNTDFVQETIVFNAKEALHMASIVWEATLEDVEEGAAIGPFFEESEVVQKNKVRGVDSATSNGINIATVVTEKLELPSTDANVAVIKWLRSRLPDKPLRGWVLDEHRAYRQVPISPAHRKWSVVALKDPHNYNRRSAAITDVLRRVFFVAGFNFYDDKYGFEPEATAASAFALAEKVHWWLGARFDQQKLQLCSDPTILGVTYDLGQYLLKIKKSRKTELFDEISMILKHEELSPGQAGKLRGKLMFGASQLWGKIGRAFLRALSDRQYSRKTSATALPIPSSGPRKTDVVIFTDGSAPSTNPKDPATEMIGGVMFTRDDLPKQFSSDVPKLIMQRWFPRKTQICMIELLAAVVAVQTFREEIRGKLVVLFIDSEPVEAALIKGIRTRKTFASS
ncbi:unnamed protein product [Symbiodinium sp. CCMP2456]|nr:unnamed protein product [Symbiodinium sp. CCMP2456]